MNGYIQHQDSAYTASTLDSKQGAAISTTNIMYVYMHMYTAVASILERSFPHTAMIIPMSLKFTFSLRVQY